LKKLLTNRIRRALHSLEALSGRKLNIPAMEFSLIDTCNLRCRQCATNAPSMKEANLPDIEEFKRSLALLSRIARCGELRFVGGEPTLNRGICNFIRAAKESGVFERIRVITNGLLLSKMTDEFWQLADLVRISVYPATAEQFSEERLQPLRDIAAKFETELDVVRDTEFFTATSDSRINDPNVLQKIFDDCGEAHGWSCHLLYRDRLFRCSRVPTLDRYLTNIEVNHENFTDEDCLLLNDRPTLLNDLKNYLSSPKPLKACSFCYGTSGPMLEHVQLTVQDIRSKVVIKSHADETNST